MRIMNPKTLRTYFSVCINTMTMNSPNLNITHTGQGKALVFFHGWGFDQSIWKSVCQEMSQDFSVYLVDLPGFGYSSMMNWERFKSLLTAKLPPQFALIGWSMGGLLATRLAMELPERVMQLINLASSPCFIRTADWPGIEKKTLDNFLTALLQNPLQTLEQFIALQLSGMHVAQTQVPSQDALEQGIRILADWDLRGQLRQSTVPTAYFFGRLDAIVPKTTLPRMRSDYPDFDYVLFKKSAHVPFLTEQRLFTTELRRLLA
jgi:pimeloyl-[acyl-carrier protein] methyl ester esterase